jgi:DNA-binding GntR family transcriptional regulator
MTRRKKEPAVIPPNGLKELQDIFRLQQKIYAELANQAATFATERDAQNFVNALMEEMIDV